MNEDVDGIIGQLAKRADTDPLTWGEIKEVMNLVMAFNNTMLAYTTKGITNAITKSNDAREEQLLVKEATRIADRLAKLGITGEPQK